MRPHRLDASLEKQCGTEAPDLSLVVTKDGALQFAVISIDDAPASPLPAGLPPAFLDQQACVYRPPVVALRAGQSLKVKNSDPLLHNVRAMSQKEAVFNVAMPVENLTIEKKLPPAPGVVDLHCDVHPWMQAWAVTFPNDLFAVTGPDGAFKIERVPVGRHHVKLWHPRLGEKVIAAEVNADATTQLESGWEVSDTGAPQ